MSAGFLGSAYYIDRECIVKTNIIISFQFQTAHSQTIFNASISWHYFFLRICVKQIQNQNVNTMLSVKRYLRDVFVFFFETVASTADLSNKLYTKACL